MRVITGTARGRRLETLPGEDVRPTAERVKEAIFSIIQFDIEGRRFLDLFAGSGQMGIEALSRGAELAVFVDAAEASVQVVRKNLTDTGLADRARVLRSDYASYLAHAGQTFDIAFLDPPYHAGILRDALEKTAACMRAHGVILCEHPVQRGEEVPLPEQAGDFVKQRVYRYGKVAVTLYRKRAEN
ncbi:MAG: 16S rRNA (guanine(966)-N(2))-methyltransferase RsmD [Clostridiales bacterium]|nr:16S rRNA (guanine(966)-N(2))-methyltransferase RsmD [Clostridiales bacterium]